MAAPDADDATPAEFAVAARLSSFAIIAMGVLGGAVAALIVFAGAKWPSGQETFWRDGAFLIWFFLIAAQVAAWPLAVLITLGMLRRVEARSPGGWREVGASAVVFWVAAFAIAIVGIYGPALPENWLPDYQTRILILSFLGIAAALAPAIGIWKAHYGLRAILDKARTDTPDRADIAALLVLKDTLNTCLALLGVLLSLAIVAAAAERNAVASYGGRYLGTKREPFDVNSVFPLNYVTLYGLLMSILVAMTYAPAHITFIAVGRRVRNLLFPITPPDEGWQDEMARRMDFESLLDLRSSTSANLKAGIVVLAPLIASLTGLLGG